MRGHHNEPKGASPGLRTCAWIPPLAQGNPFPSVIGRGKPNGYEWKKEYIT